MHKNKMLKILNPILAVLTVTQAFSALLADRLSHEAFEWIHQGGGTLLLIGIALHVVFNWSWVRASLLTHRRS